MAKASLIGAVIFVLFTLFTQCACWSLAGSGESGLALLLLLPWVAAFAPLRLCYRLFDVDWRVGEYGGIESIMLQQAMILNAALGGLLGAAVWKMWQVAKRFWTRNGHT